MTPHSSESRLRLRALLLAAGRGKRLRPLTLELPKPLLPVAGRPLAAWSLDRFSAVGCATVALNLHHLGAAIRAQFGDRFEPPAARPAGGRPSQRSTPIAIRYSDESAELLGTGGALPPLAEFLSEAPIVLVVNSDSLCRWPLAELGRHHRRSGAKVTLLLHRTVDPDDFGGGVAVERGRVVAFRRGALAWESTPTKRVFAGAAAIDPGLVTRLPRGPSDIVRALYEPMLEAGEPIAALETARPWFDLGTPARYLDGALAWALRALPERGFWSAPQAPNQPSASIDPSAKLRRVAVEAGATVAAKSRLEETLVLPGAAVGAGARLERTIVGPGVRVPEGARFSDVLLTRNADGAGLVATPLEPPSGDLPSPRA